MDISVIIPCGNGRLQNLNFVLTSLEMQTMKNFAVIVVNDGSNDDSFSVCRAHPELDITYIHQPKHVAGSGTTQPRNRGARCALTKFVVFADSDVILHPNALEYYTEDFEENPNRIIVGMYHWLKWMRISQRDVKTRFDDIIEERLPAITTPPDSHSINRDIRSELFAKQDQHFVYQFKTPQEKFQGYPVYLAMFSGNIAWNVEQFWSIGGYWDELEAGAHEDGASGIAACLAGIPISFDRRIIGGHLNHRFNVEHRRKLWEVEIPKINSKYGLDDYTDGSNELYDHLPSLETMSQRNLEFLGVAEWKTKGIGKDDKTGFRGA